MGFTPVNKGELNCRCHVGGKVALMKRCLFVQTCTPDLMSTTCPRFHYIPRRKKSGDFYASPSGMGCPSVEDEPHSITAVQRDTNKGSLPVLLSTWCLITGMRRREGDDTKSRCRERDAPSLCPPPSHCCCSHPVEKPLQNNVFCWYVKLSVFTDRTSKGETRLFALTTVVFPIQWSSIIHKV